MSHDHSGSWIVDIKLVIGAIQKSLGIEVDGKPGPQTWKAIAEKTVPKQAAD